MCNLYEDLLFLPSSLSPFTVGDHPYLSSVLATFPLMTFPNPVSGWQLNVLLPTYRKRELDCHIFFPFKLVCLSFFTLIPARVKHLILRSSPKEMVVPAENKLDPNLLLNALAQDQCLIFSLYEVVPLNKNKKRCLT